MGRDARVHGEVTAEDQFTEEDGPRPPFGILAAVAVLAVAIGAGTVLLLRDTGGEEGPGPSAAIPTVSRQGQPMDGVQPEVDDHKNVPRVLPMSEVRVGGGGTRDVDGIPAGFAGTVDGGVAAATTFLSVRPGPGIWVCFWWNMMNRCAVTRARISAGISSTCRM